LKCHADLLLKLETRIERIIMRSYQKGFTLLEVILIIIIVGNQPSNYIGSFGDVNLSNCQSGEWAYQSGDSSNGNWAVVVYRAKGIFSLMEYTSKEKQKTE